MKHRHITILFLSLLWPALAQCMGDASMLVRGRLESRPSVPQESCRLQLHTAEGRLLDEQAIDPIFEVDFVIEPRLRSYQFKVVCDKSGLVFVGDFFKAGTAQLSRIPIELGVIQVRPMAAKNDRAQ